MPDELPVRMTFDLLRAAEVRWWIRAVEAQRYM
jgi:hypothetical protein